MVTCCYCCSGTQGNTRSADRRGHVLPPTNHSGMWSPLEPQDSVPSLPPRADGAENLCVTLTGALMPFSSQSCVAIDSPAFSPNPVPPPPSPPTRGAGRPPGRRQGLSSTEQACHLSGTGRRACQEAAWRGVSVQQQWGRESSYCVVGTRMNQSWVEDSARD